MRWQVTFPKQTTMQREDFLVARYLATLRRMDPAIAAFVHACIAEIRNDPARRRACLATWRVPSPEAMDALSAAMRLACPGITAHPDFVEWTVTFTWLHK
jgi:thymidylate synthase